MNKLEKYIVNGRKEKIKIRNIRSRSQFEKKLDNDKI